MKTCSKLAIEASEKLGNFNDVISERPHFEHILVSWKIITVNPVATYVATFGSYLCYGRHMNA